MKYSVFSLTVCMVMVTGLTAGAATNCRVFEFPDHYEAVCDGNEIAVPASVVPGAASANSSVPEKKAATSAQPSIAEKKVAARAESMKRLLDYRLNRPIKAGWKEKLAMRMRLIREGQQQRAEEERTVPEPDPMGVSVSDQPVMTPGQGSPVPTVEPYPMMGD